jgi:hypothetical protein
MACAIHCVAAPVLVLIAPGIAVGSRAEWWLLYASTALAGWLLARGWQVHRRTAIAVLGLAGLSIWATSLAHVTRPIPEPVTTVVGAMMVAVALYSNARVALGRSRRSGGRSTAEAELASDLRLPRVEGDECDVARAGYQVQGTREVPEVRASQVAGGEHRRDLRAERPIG